MFFFSLLLFSCAPAPVQEPSPQVWQGWVYGDIPAESTPGLEAGTITMASTDGVEIYTGEQRDEARLGMWTFEVEPNIDVAIRVEGPEHYPTIWRTHTPI